MIDPDIHEPCPTCGQPDCPGCANSYDDPEMRLLRDLRQWVQAGEPDIWPESGAVPGWGEPAEPQDWNDQSVETAWDDEIPQ